jgi:hypothetical protein
MTGRCPQSEHSAVAGLTISQQYGQYGRPSSLPTTGRSWPHRVHSARWCLRQQPCTEAALVANGDRSGVAAVAAWLGRALLGRAGAAQAAFLQLDRPVPAALGAGAGCGGLVEAPVHTEPSGCGNGRDGFGRTRCRRRAASASAGHADRLAVGSGGDRPGLAAVGAGLGGAGGTVAADAHRAGVGAFVGRAQFAAPVAGFLGSRSGSPWPK